MLLEWFNLNFEYIRNKFRIVKSVDIVSIQRYFIVREYEKPWMENGQLGMTVKSKSDSSALLSFGDGQSEVELNQLSTDAGGLDRGTAFGRTAFAVPGGDLKEVESSVKAAGYNIQTPFVTLPTPGKADVQVVIFADPVSLYQLVKYLITQ